MNLDNEEKAKILWEFKDGFAAYKKELAKVTIKTKTTGTVSLFQSETL